MMTASRQHPRRSPLGENHITLARHWECRRSGCEIEEVKDREPNQSRDLSLDHKGVVPHTRLRFVGLVLRGGDDTVPYT
jgi:hypothetical protein